MNTIYEIIRVIRNQPIFLEEHLDRLDQSLGALDVTHQVDRHLIKKEIYRLSTEDHRLNFNIRINYHHKIDEYTIEALTGHYPTPEMENEGVVVATYEYKRDNPNVKVYDRNLRQSMQDRKEDLDVFEVLYVDDELIYEGSKSNVFFIMGETIVTTSDSEVLQGITRMMVLKVCEELGYKVEKREIHREELVLFDAAFLTGTSINVLPIRRVDDQRFNARHPMIDEISLGYKTKVIEELDKPMVIDNEE